MCVCDQERVYIRKFCVYTGGYVGEICENACVDVRIREDSECEENE